MQYVDERQVVDILAMGHYGAMSSGRHLLNMSSTTASTGYSLIMSPERSEFPFFSHYHSQVPTSPPA